MTPTFRVKVLSPDKKIYEGEAQSLVAPAALGYVGILAHHAPFLTTLVPGHITIRNAEGQTTAFTCNGTGFLEVLNNTALLLVESAQPR